MSYVTLAVTAGKLIAQETVVAGVRWWKSLSAEKKKEYKEKLLDGLAELGARVWRKKEQMDREDAKDYEPEFDFSNIDTETQSTNVVH